MLTVCDLPQTIIAEKAFPDNVFRREDIPVYIHLNFFIMFDLSSIILKIDDLKAKVENDSITPTCLGSLLDGIVAAIRDIDMTDYKQTIVSSKNDAEKALDDAAKATNIASAAQDKAIANAGNITILAANLEKLKQTVNTLYGQNATDAIESFNEVIDFLAGLKDDESLALLLSDINTRILAVNTTLEQLAARIATEEDQRNNADEDLNAKVSKALIASDRFVRFDGILDQEHDAEFVPPGVYFFNNQKRFGRTNGRDVDFGAFDGYELFDEPDLHVYYDNAFKLYHYDGNVLNPYVVSVAGKGLSANDYTNEDKAKLTRLLPNGQFGYTGHYGMDGKFYTAPNYANSGLIPVNRNFDIEFAANVGGSVASVVFYDGAKRFISAIQIPQTLAAQVLPAADIPEDATFFIISTFSPAQSYYCNGLTIESREGAVSEAIQAAITAAVDEALIAEAKVAGATFNESTGFFELNTLTDITAEQMRSILKFGCFRFTEPKSGARSKNTTIKDLIRTNILVSSSDELRGFSTANGLCYNQHEMEVLVVGLPPQYEQIYAFSPKSIYTMLTRCYKLHTIIGDIRLDKLETANEQAFVSCTALKNVRLKDIVKGLDISGAPLLSFESVACMVDNAKNTEAIPIKVHPTVYGKLTDEQADIMALLPENMLTGPFARLSGVDAIDNGVEAAAPGFYFCIGVSPRLLGSSGGKLTLSCDVEGLPDGESVALLVGSSTESRPTWTISTNGRAVFLFNFDSRFKINSSNELLIYEAANKYTGQGLKLTNFKLSYGEHDALPYTPPLSSITDDATREIAEWLSLMQIAEARQINFVTTE